MFYNEKIMLTQKHTNSEILPSPYLRICSNATITSQNEVLNSAVLFTFVFSQCRKLLSRHPRQMVFLGSTDLWIFHVSVAKNAFSVVLRMTEIYELDGNIRIRPIFTETILNVLTCPSPEH